jgi:phosphoesterase RecJ-like protein
VLAARLLATGIDHAAISQRLFDTAPFGWLRLLSVATARAALEPEVGAGLVWTWSSTAEAVEHGLPGDQLEALIDVVRATREADVACVLKGQDDGSWAVSLRSRGSTDVARVATALGGGGHRAAAGYTSPLDREATMAALREELSARG